ncbi:WcaI family glycosyltransferase [Pedobacter sp. AW31-3R]|uniref:WcaI family glycosyltransferase n=1 Tax=Pedobacter sp. AW31-3R TaxID=3445781 RepID=UPI003F9F894B
MKPKNSTSKKILMMGINFAPELTGIGKYTGEMAHWLVDQGYQCTVLTSFPYYPNWKIQSPYSGNFYKKEVLRNGMLNLYRCPLYIPEKPSALRRILHDASFWLSALLMTIYLLFKPRHTHIFCMAPPFHLGFLAMLYRFFKGGKIIYHIHDLQIEAARDLKVIKVKQVFSLLFALEQLIISHADVVSTISLGMLKKISAKTKKAVLLFPNWVDTNLFYPLWPRQHLKKEWGFQESDKVVLYSGSVGEKQGLESLITIAKTLEKHHFIKFVICGNGPYKQKLEQLAKENKLLNISFLPTQPLDKFNQLLNMTDVHLVLQKKNACDLMMPSKLTAIWASGGLALVTAEPGSTLHMEILENKMGVVIACENDQLLLDAILDCCTNDHTERHINGRNYAERSLNKHQILGNLMQQLHEPVSLPNLIVSNALVQE